MGRRSLGFATRMNFMRICRSISTPARYYTPTGRSIQNQNGNEEEYNNEFETV
jgi:hypothetical protein